jgi:site-specific recombinase XerC
VVPRLVKRELAAVWKVNGSQQSPVAAGQGARGVPFYAGGRLAETVALDVDDVSYPGARAACASTARGERVREVPLHREPRKALTDWLEERRDWPAELLGHARLETTRVYTRPTAEDRSKAVDLLPLDE